LSRKGTHAALVTFIIIKITLTTAVFLSTPTSTGDRATA